MQGLIETQLNILRLNWNTKKKFKIIATKNRIRYNFSPPYILCIDVVANRRSYMFAVKQARLELIYFLKHEIASSR